jgi:2,5-furandicarboxylate decarboxylase 1
VTLTSSHQRIDTEKFRLRTFVETLRRIGELEQIDEPVPLAELSLRIEASTTAKLFTCVGPQKYQIAAGMAAGRKRLAAAFGVPERETVHEYMRRLATPQAVVEIPSSDAPVHAVVVTGDDIDLNQLPFHLQHEFDGGVYISTAIDFSVEPSGRRNIGCRRLMLRGRDTLQANLTAESDLKRAYIASVKRGERYPVTFVIGSSPLDYLAATQRQQVDEFDLLAAVRGETMAMVRGITNDIPVPADAELTIEGYFDELGYREMEGPYGEFYGFYGPSHIDPVFHVTAITHRHDVLHHTLQHSGKLIARADGSNLASLSTEVATWRALRAFRIEPAAVHAAPASTGRLHVRVALKEPRPGQARTVISALFALPVVKQVVVVDEDVDVCNDEEILWAMNARFRADRDLIVTPGMPANYADPMTEQRTIAKIGYDCTKPIVADRPIDEVRAFSVPLTPNRTCATVREALASGPRFFSELIVALGSRDGREIAMELDELRQAGVLERKTNGSWYLTG